MVKMETNLVSACDASQLVTWPDSKDCADTEVSVNNRRAVKRVKSYGKPAACRRSKADTGAKHHWHQPRHIALDFTIQKSQQKLDLRDLQMRSEMLHLHIHYGALEKLAPLFEGCLPWRSTGSGTSSEHAYFTTPCTIKESLELSHNDFSYVVEVHDFAVGLLEEPAIYLHEPSAALTKFMSRTKAGRGARSMSSTFQLLLTLVSDDQILPA